MFDKLIVLFFGRELIPCRWNCSFNRDDCFEPYANENGVSPVNVLDVILYNQSTPGSSSAHLALAFSSLLCSVFTLVLLVDLT